MWTVCGEGDGRAAHVSPLRPKAGGGAAAGRARAPGTCSAGLGGADQARGGAEARGEHAESGLAELRAARELSEAGKPAWRTSKGRAKLAEGAKRAFDACDADGTGTISRREFAALTAALGLDMTNREREATFDRLDVDRSEAVAFAEFLPWYRELKTLEGVVGSWARTAAKGVW